MEGFIFAVIIIISIIGWISNAINENKQKNQNAQRGGQQRPPKKRNLQGELESFLQELQGEKKKPQQRPAQPQRQQKQSTKKSKRSTTVSSQQHRTSQQKSKEAVGTGRSEHHSVFEDNATHHVGSGDLGSGLKKHVEEYIESRHVGSPDSDIAAKRPAREKSAYSRAGSKSASSTTVPANRQAFELLQSTDNIRAAIILNEILQPPVSQRSDRF